MSKYFITTETEDIITEKAELLEYKHGCRYLYVPDNHMLYRILNEDETEDKTDLQPDALLVCQEEESELRMCELGHFSDASKAFDCVRYNMDHMDEILSNLERMANEEAQKEPEISEDAPKTYIASYMFNYFGGDHIGDKKITGACVDVAFRPYKDKELVQFTKDAEPMVIEEVPSRVIGTRKNVFTLSDVVNVSFDRNEIVKLTINSDIMKRFMAYYGWSMVEVSIHDYELDYEVANGLYESWYCGKETFESFLKSHADDFDISDNRNADCPAYGWTDK